MASRSGLPDQMALVRKLQGGGASGAIVRAMTGTEMSAALPLAVLKSIYLGLKPKPEERTVVNGDENHHAKEQVDGAEPMLKVVKILVKPKVHSGKTVGSLVDESMNWEKSSKKWKDRRTQKTAFVQKEVPYDEWRKHYAKDRLGKYRGLEEPAEDCLLTAEDEIKYRSPKQPEMVEVDSTLQPEDDAPAFGGIRRAATMPEHSEAFDVESQSSRTPSMPTVTEEAVFVQSDGHVAVQDIEVEQLEQQTECLSVDASSPTSFSNDFSNEIPAEPESSIAKRSWTRRLSKLRRSSSSEII